MSAGADAGAEPTADEVAAIAAAVDALWPRPVAVTPLPVVTEPPAWRFSGRWWSAGPIRRRDRP